PSTCRCTSTTGWSSGSCCATVRSPFGSSCRARPWAWRPRRCPGSSWGSPPDGEGRRDVLRAASGPPALDGGDLLDPLGPHVDLVRALHAETQRDPVANLGLRPGRGPLDGRLRAELP